MSYENIITDEISLRLKNPIIKVLQEIKIDKILKKSNFIKKDGAATSTILLHFIFMIVINKKISEFIKYSKESLSKDVYYRALKSSKYNWQKMLMLSTVAFINKLKSLQNIKAVKVLILDDTNEDKKGKKIEGVCDNIWSNKDKKTIRGINLVSLNYNDGYTNFMLDFAIKFNDKMRVKLEDFKNQYYYTSDSYKRKKEGLETKFTIAISMVKRAIKAGIKADYLLVDSWYSKPIFVKSIKDLDLDIISRITNSPTAWQFSKRDNNKHKTLSGIYRILSKSISLKFAKYNKIKYSYCSKILHHKTAGIVKVVFIKTNNKDDFNGVYEDYCLGNFNISQILRNLKMLMAGKKLLPLSSMVRTFFTVRFIAMTTYGFNKQVVATMTVGQHFMRWYQPQANLKNILQAKI